MRRTSCAECARAALLVISYWPAANGVESQIWFLHLSFFAFFFDVIPDRFIVFLEHQHLSRKAKRNAQTSKTRNRSSTTLLYLANGRSRPKENRRTGGGECRPGTGSPRNTFALARWMQHEITPYQRHISRQTGPSRAQSHEQRLTSS